MAKKKRVAIIAVVIAVIVIAAAVYVFVPRTSDTVEAAGDQILTVSVKEGSVSVRVEGPSIVEPYRYQEIRSRTSGIVVESAQEGDELAEGEVLVRFDRTDLQNGYRQAELNLEQARLDVKRFSLAYDKARSTVAEKERLFANGSVSKDQVDEEKESLANAEISLESAKIKVSQNELALEKAKAELDGATVIAPFSGVVLSSNVAAGDSVNAGSVLVNFADLSRVRLKAEVDEFDIGKLEDGMAVTVTSDTLGSDSIKSKVERISPSAEIINNISIFTVSTVLNNDEMQLRPGMSADVSILVSSDQGIVVPSKAISTTRGRSYLKVYENEEVVTKRVTVGADDGVNTAVTEGLLTGDIVVLPSTGGINLTSTAGTIGTSIVPITVPGTGGSR